MRRRAISLVSHINPHTLIQIESLILCLQGLSKYLPTYKRSKELQPIQGRTRYVLEKYGDFGAFCDAELHIRVRCIAMDGDLLTVRLSPSFEKDRALS